MNNVSAYPTYHTICESRGKKRTYISSFQVKLHFTDDALRIIAKKAMAKNTGARGLRAILESILTEAMYEVCFSSRVEILLI